MNLNKIPSDEIIDLLNLLFLFGIFIVIPIIAEIIYLDYTKNCKFKMNVRRQIVCSEQIEIVQMEQFHLNNRQSRRKEGIVLCYTTRHTFSATSSRWRANEKPTFE